MKKAFYLIITLLLSGCSPSSQDAEFNSNETKDNLKSSMVASAEIPIKQNSKIGLEEGAPEPEISYMNDPTILSSAKTFYIPIAERIRLAKAAENGDEEAGFKLSKHFKFSDPNLDLENYWLKVAAENGNEIAQYNLAFNLIEAGRNDEEKQEGLRLMRKCADAGIHIAKSYLRANKKQ